MGIAKAGHPRSRPRSHPRSRAVGTRGGCSPGSRPSRAARARAAQSPSTPPRPSSLTCQSQMYGPPLRALTCCHNSSAYSSLGRIALHSLQIDCCFLIMTSCCCLSDCHLSDSADLDCCYCLQENCDRKCNSSSDSHKAVPADSYAVSQDASVCLCPVMRETDVRAYFA